jgi:hypothetical protein
MLSIFEDSWEKNCTDILIASLILDRQEITKLILERLFKLPEELLIKVLSGYSTTGNTFLMKVILEDKFEIINFIGMHIPITTFADLLLTKKIKKVSP